MKSVTGLIATVYRIKLTDAVTSDVDIFEGLGTSLHQSRYPRRVTTEVPPTVEPLKTNAAWQVQQLAYDGFETPMEMKHKGPGQRG